MFRRDEIVNSENGDYYGFLYQVITSSRRVFIVFNEQTRSQGANLFGLNQSRTSIIPIIDTNYRILMI